MTLPPRVRLTRRQLATLGLLFLGYVGYYFCRSNLAVLKSQLIREQPDSFNDERIGYIVSAGIFAYLVGKLTTGPLCDFLDGKRMFLAGMILSILFTVAIGLTAGFTSLLVFWICNRYAQSIGWSGLVKVASRWFPATHYGLILGILSLSYQFGDSLAKLCLGAVLNRGFTATPVFLFSAGILAIVALVTWRFLRASPVEVGEPEPEVNPANVYGHSGADSHPQNLATLIKPLLLSPTFWLVCVMCGGLTFIRETLNFWTPGYLESALHLSSGDAAMYSSIFPLIGGSAAVVMGLTSDHWPGRRRSAILAYCLFPLTGLLVAMAVLTQTAGLMTQVSLLSAVFFFLVGPYSALGGAMALDLGARRGGATTAGLVDSAGYCVGSLSGAAGGMLAREAKWSTLFGVLAAASAVALVAAVVLWLVVERRR